MKQQLGFSFTLDVDTYTCMSDKPVLQVQHFTKEEGFHDKLAKYDFVQTKSGYNKTT